MITTGAGGQIQVAGGTTAMYFASSGRVGIGTTTPTSALDVVGTVKATAFDGVNKVIYATAEKAVSTWTDRTIDASFWRSVTWSPELSLFVAVATTGTNRAATSPDGITWTNRTIDFSGWKSVTWSPDLSLFVAVAFSGTNRVATSPDGVTWTGRTIAPNLWQSVTWSPELSLFVAVAFYKAATSPDVVTWTSRTINTGSQWRAVTWSPELSLFVAVAKSGTNRVATSPDGVTWTDRVINTVSKWQSVTWSPELSLFVAVGDYGSVKCTTSPDGITWTDRVISTAHGWESVTWSPELSLFVAVASTGTNRVATSPDGVTWTNRTINTGSDWYGVAWSPELSLFVAVAGTGTNRVATSNFGIPTSLNTPMAHPVQLSVDTVNSRVGIGTTTPTSALDVNGTVTATTFSASGPTTGAAHGSSSILYLLNTPLIKEWQWTGSTNNTLRVTFSTSELPTNCKAIYADVFMPQHSTDDHVGHALGKNAGEQTMWTSGRNVQPSTVFGNLALQQCFLSMPGQTDAFEYYYGNWWNSCIIPLDTTNTLYHTVSGEGATSSWVYMVIKGYFH